MQLKEIFDAAASMCTGDAVSRDELLALLVEALSSSASGSPFDPVHTLEDLIRREREASTGFGLGVAIPHCFLPGEGKPRLAVARITPGVNFHAMDGKPTHLVFLLLEHAGSRSGHTAILSRIARLCRDTDLIARLSRARGPVQLGEAIAAAEDALR